MSVWVEDNGKDGDEREKVTVGVGGEKLLLYSVYFNWLEQNGITVIIPPIKPLCPCPDATS
jgi:hypothetical protein